ncbi:MAG: hypothetical protein ACJ8F7_05340 [Gemmataceae bacterium]
MNREPLDVVPLWGLLLASCAMGWLAVEGGYRYGSWRHRKSAEEKENPVGAMAASILGLLAFLLAFTFSLAATRYDARRQIVLDEANAIGTTYLRARLLPEPHQTNVSGLLREYVDVRVRGVEEKNVAEAITRSEVLHELIWSEAVKASKNKESNSEMTRLFIQSLNEMIDLHAKRLFVGLGNRIPSAIWVGLFALAMLSMVGVGYQAGISATRRSPAMAGLILAIAGVLFLIADLDRFSEGFLTVSQHAMLDLQRTMHAAKP